MKKNEQVLIKRARYIQGEFQKRKGNAGEIIGELAKELFLSESTIEKDLKKDV